MKKYNLKMFALGLLAMATISSCSYQTRRPERKPPRHDGHHDDHRGDRGGDHYDRHY